MKSALNHFMDCLFAGTSESLITAEQQKQLTRIAAQLPATSRILLECRLAANSSRVDLSQSILANPVERNRLLACFQARTDSTGHMQRLHSFLSAWNNPQSVLYNGIKGIWLEFDNFLPIPAATMLVPNLFLTLDSNQTDGEQAIYDLADCALKQLLDPGQVSVLLKTADDCIASLPAGATPAYLGIMLARDPVYIRLQLAGIAQQDVKSCLQSLGMVITPELTDTINLAYTHTTSVVLCLDIVGSELSDVAGFELFFDSGADRTDAITRTLDESVSRGLCSPVKRTALLNHEQHLKPDHARQPWPDYLVAESILTPAETLCSLQSSINHLKLNYTPGKPLEAKAYLALNWHKLGLPKSALAA